CDIIDVDGKPIPPLQVQSSYGTAQKMRAALSYTFGTVHGHGRTPWHKSETSGQWVGNPSISNLVGDYLPSLRRRKMCVRRDHTLSSSNFSTQRDFLKIYDHNTSLHEYGDGLGKNARLEIQSINTMGFQLLLRSDDVLNIRMENITFELDDNGKRTLTKIVLDRRKNDPFNIKTEPFWIHLQPVYLSHLCAFRALCFWISAARHTTGYLYRLVSKKDCVTRMDRPLSSRKYLEMLRLNLLEVGIDPASYGTHCLRRGGTQYFYIVKGVKFTDLCHWGGWVLDLKSSNSIWRYLIGLIDEHEFDRRDFLNPNRCTAVKCYICGRCS
ncbi:hypothetical protein B0H13DRAFT_1627146, partial [Mycena leptocephala]